MIINFISLNFALIIDQILYFLTLAWNAYRWFSFKSLFDFACLWQRVLPRSGAYVFFACPQSETVKVLMQNYLEFIIVDVVLKYGTAFAISVFASFRAPTGRVVFIINTSVFSEAYIFKLC